MSSERGGEPIGTSMSWGFLGAVANGRGLRGSRPAVKPVVEVRLLPPVIALLEYREPRAREDLNAWMERLREVQEHGALCQERLDCARIGREEVLWALAEEGEAVAGAREAEALATPPASAGSQAAEPGPDAAADASDGPVVPTGLPAGYDPRPPVWRAGGRPEVLAGQYRQPFEAVLARTEPVSARELTTCPGRDAQRLNEVEKVRHRAYALKVRGWLARERPVHPGCGPSRGGRTCRQVAFSRGERDAGRRVFRRLHRSLGHRRRLRDRPSGLTTTPTLSVTSGTSSSPELLVATSDQAPPGSPALVATSVGALSRLISTLSRRSRDHD
ncbi:hypothetical protein GCM10010317_092890 [Streptomyces mirabilis]|jgi:hypothetical protein|uniref:hypothetical protein n=1 Tax=Streptomyces mirabilis TaxID=68239 RepID=UPI00167DA68D|nr:hypothetical protein [Streptomyces mirabilis]GHD76398.1 hypothetical protein GCM10010317_092890 [Streptomyces mirabilis]